VLDSRYLHVGEYNLAGMDFWNVKEHWMAHQLLLMV